MAHRNRGLRLVELVARLKAEVVSRLGLHDVLDRGKVLHIGNQGLAFVERLGEEQRRLAGLEGQATLALNV